MQSAWSIAGAADCLTRNPADLAIRLPKSRRAQSPGRVTYGPLAERVRCSLSNCERFLGGSVVPQIALNLPGGLLQSADIARSRRQQPIEEIGALKLAGFPPAPATHSPDPQTLPDLALRPAFRGALRARRRQTGPWCGRATLFRPWSAMRNSASPEFCLGRGRDGFAIRAVNGRGIGNLVLH